MYRVSGSRVCARGAHTYGYTLGGIDAGQSIADWGLGIAESCAEGGPVFAQRTGARTGGCGPQWVRWVLWPMACRLCEVVLPAFSSGVVEEGVCFGVVGEFSCFVVPEEFGVGDALGYGAQEEHLGQGYGVVEV